MLKISKKLCTPKMEAEFIEPMERLLKKTTVGFPTYYSNQEIESLFTKYVNSQV